MAQSERPVSSEEGRRFALIGAAGFVAPRHLRAIHDTGHQLVAAADPHDSVGVLDRYFPEARYFTQIERFDRFLEKQRRQNSPERADYVSICSPNYLHDAHVRLALRVRAHAICEKPLVINPWNLDQLSELEEEYERRVHTVLQLRVHPAIERLRANLGANPGQKPHEVELTYVTRRGPWYHKSWKGSEEKSGGLAMNIGVHFFDLLLWLFGAARACQVHMLGPERGSGYLELERAHVRWYLSINGSDLPPGFLDQGLVSSRTLTVDGDAIGLSGGFDDLHTRVYEEILSGRGTRICDARPSIELVRQIREATLDAEPSRMHPFLSSREKP